MELLVPTPRTALIANHLQLAERLLATKISAIPVRLSIVNQVPSSADFADKVTKPISATTVRLFSATVLLPTKTSAFAAFSHIQPANADPTTSAHVVPPILRLCVLLAVNVCHHSSPIRRMAPAMHLQHRLAQLLARLDQLQPRLVQHLARLLKIRHQVRRFQSLSTSITHALL